MAHEPIGKQWLIYGLLLMVTAVGIIAIRDHGPNFYKPTVNLQIAQSLDSFQGIVVAGDPSNTEAPQEGEGAIVDIKYQVRENDTWRTIAEANGVKDVNRLQEHFAFILPVFGMEITIPAELLGESL